jgi:hypothetical protein
MKKKTCSTCKRNDVEFGKNRAHKDGLDNVCRGCASAYRKAWRINHKERESENASKGRKARKNSLRIYALRYAKQHGCADCGETDPVVLEFDHVKGSKRNEISYMINATVSLQTLKTEIAKCEIRCSNCHKRKTAEQFNWYDGIDLENLG